MNDHIEPTEAQVAAFQAGWEAEDAVRDVYHEAKPGDRTKAGLRAALNLRDESVPPLPSEPGYYVGEQRGLGPIVIELLAAPGVSGHQWIDAGDRNYLDETQVRALMPLVRLIPELGAAQ